MRKDGGRILSEGLPSKQVLLPEEFIGRLVSRLLRSLPACLLRCFDFLQGRRPDYLDQ